MPRLRRMLGPERTSTSSGRASTRSSAGACDRFRHGRVIFAGDAAHQVSPFGARGAQQRLPGHRQPRLEAAAGAGRARAGAAARQLRRRADGRGRREHPQLHARTDFITPKSRGARVSRRGAAARAPARLRAPLVNSGRLSRPWSGAAAAPAAAARTGADAPGTTADWLLRHIGADGRFTLVAREAVPPAPARHHPGAARRCAAAPARCTTMRGWPPRAWALPPARPCCSARTSILAARCAAADTAGIARRARRGPRRMSALRTEPAARGPRRALRRC